MATRNSSALDRPLDLSVSRKRGPDDRGLAVGVHSQDGDLHQSAVPSTSGGGGERRDATGVSEVAGPVERMVLQFCRLGPVMEPTRATHGSAGIDIYAPTSLVLLSGEGWKRLPTRLCVKIPNGYFGWLAGRSGNALHKQIEVFSGIIDSDYRGEVSVLFRNIGGTPRVIKQGSRCAQLIILPFLAPFLQQVRPPKNVFTTGQPSAEMRGDSSDSNSEDDDFDLVQCSSMADTKQHKTAQFRSMAGFGSTGE